MIVVIYVVWSGASESIYSLSSAHANDRAAKDDLVTLSSTMLFAWSVSGFLVPGIGTALTASAGTQAFMYRGDRHRRRLLRLRRLAYRQGTAVPPAETGSFSPMTAQAPLAVDLAFPQAEPLESGAEPISRLAGRLGGVGFLELPRGRP